MVILSQRVRNGYGEEIFSMEYANELSEEGEYSMVARFGCDNDRDEYELA